MCYWDWKLYVKQEIEKLKQKHWRSFLAKAESTLAFKELSYTVLTSTGLIAPLYRANKSIATDKKEQAELIFSGTSIALTECHLKDVPTDPPPPIGNFLIITEFEVENVMILIPNKKATGRYRVLNELIKLAKSLRSPHLTNIFNHFLKIDFYPVGWKKAITAIICKPNKADYLEPNAYRPIVLLNCLSKIFEAILTKLLAHWAETNCILAEGHNGG